MQKEHQINASGEKTGLRLGIDACDEAQSIGTMHTGYIFSGSNWLCGGVFFNDVPPTADMWYVIVEPGKQPVFHYGMDSMQHPDITAYNAYCRFVIEDADLLPGEILNDFK